MSGDWLEEPASTPGLPATVPVPDDYKSRLALLEVCWARLTPNQRAFLTAWRDCRFNARAACRQLGLSENTRPATKWMEEDDYSAVARIWRANAAANALDKDRLLARQDDIVETLLTPRPVLHQGIPVLHNGKILEEVDAGAASRANEVLLDRAMPKPRADVEVGVAVQLPSIKVELTRRPDETVVDAACVEVDTALPAQDWLS